MFTKNVERNIEQVLAATPNKAPTIQPPAAHHENCGDARGVMVNVVGIGHDDTSSNPGRGLIAFHIALIPLGKV